MDSRTEKAKDLLLLAGYAQSVFKMELGESI
jgi:hypothetical protein